MTSYLEISPLDCIQDITIKSVKLFCSCCLSESVDLIEATKCHHYKSYKTLFRDTPAQAPDGLYVCVLCHAMLIKINKFNLMVNHSELILRNRVNSVKTSPFIQLEISNQNEEIRINRDMQSKNIKVEPIAEAEVKNESVDTDTVYLLSREEEEKNIEQTNTYLTQIEPIEEFEVKSESVDADTVCLLSYEEKKGQNIKETNTHIAVFEAPLLDEMKVYPVPEHWDGKIEYINLTPEQLNQEKKEMANHVSFIALEFKCHDCIIGFNYEYKYNSHMEMRHVKKEDGILCEICKCYVANRNVKKHMSTHYGRWQCCQCKTMVKSKYAIISHYNKTHEKLKGYDFKCDQCEYEARSYKTLQYHKRKHKSKNKFSYECKKCCKYFINKESYKNHMVSYHYTNQRFECNICNKVFKMKQNLRSHNKQVHEADDTTYLCDICHLTFNRISTWKSHVAGHYNEFECDYCGLKFNRKYAIKDHIMWKHLKSSTLVCKICDKLFSAKKTLTSHIRTVHQETKQTQPKNKICDYCGKRFATSGILKNHINTHTGARPFNCKYCSANFGHKSTLYTHTRLLHLGGKRKRELLSVAE